MSMNNLFLTLILVVALIATIGVLIWFATGGSVIAGFVLGILTAAVMIFAGSGISLIQTYIASKREQENFQANAKENLNIMLAMQKIQNSQNTQLLRQARELPLLGQNGTPPTPSFDFAENIFDELGG